MLNHFPKKTYGQRWQIETTFSMLKRLLGSALRSRKRYAIDREIVLRVLTINLMIGLRLLSCFQQSMTVPIYSNSGSRRWGAPVFGPSLNWHLHFFQFWFACVTLPR